MYHQISKRMKKIFISWIFLVISAVTYGQLSEGFETGTFESEWTTYFTEGTKTGWKIGKTDSISNLSGQKKVPTICDKYTAIAICGTGAKNVDSWLITPKIHIESGQYLNFMLAATNAYALTHDTLDIMVSTTTTEKTAFNQRIHRIIPRSPIAWGINSIDLSAFDNQDIYIGFRDYHAAQGSFMRETLYLDNISISTIPSYDLALEAIISPSNSCNTLQYAKLVIKNNGIETTSFDAYYQIQGQTAVKETVIQTIPSGDQATITLANPIILQEGYDNKLTFWMKNSKEDAFLNNDTVSTTIRIGSELVYPYTMSTDSSQVVKDFTSMSGQSQWLYTIPTDKDMAAWALSGRPGNIRGCILTSNCITPTSDKVAVSFKYLSSALVNIVVSKGAPYNGMLSATDTLELPITNEFEEITYILPITGASTAIGFSAYFPTATFNTICEVALKDISFSDATPDIKADQIMLPLFNDIALSNKKSIIKVKYDNIGAGDIDDLKLCYQIDAESIIRESITEKIAEGCDFVYTFNTQPTFTTTGKHSLTIWSESEMDSKAGNDTIFKEINVYEAKTFPFSETFTDPVNWSILNENEDMVYWTFAEHERAIKDESIAYKNSISGVESNEYLISPAIHMPVGKARLSFYYATSTYNTGSGKLKVLTGTDPDNLTTVLFDQALTNSGWLNGYAPLNVEAEGNYYFAFYAYGTSGEIFLDYINIDAKEDLCINSIAYSEANGFNKMNSDVTISFINHGVETQSNIEVAYAIGTTDSPHVETITTPIAPGDTLTYTFNEKVNISIPDSTYNLIGLIYTKVGEDAINDVIIGNSITHWKNRTLPYIQNFEVSTDIEKWTLNTQLNNWQIQSNASNAYDNNQYIYHASNYQKVSDDWIFSECIEIPAGTYDLSYFYRTWKGMNADSYKQNLKVMLGTDANPESMTQTIADYKDLIVSQPAYNKHTDKLTIKGDGKYYLGFQCYSNAGNGAVYIDNIQITLPEQAKDLPYSANFENNEEEWTKYNPSSTFYQWTYTTSGFDSYMSVKRTSPFTQQEGMFVSPALQLEENRPLKLNIDYAVISTVDTIVMELYCGTVNNPDSMIMLKGLPITENLTQITYELEVPKNNIYYFGLKSNSTNAIYELKLAEFTADYTSPSAIEKTKGENIGIYLLDNHLQIISGENIQQVIISDISGKTIYNCKNIKNKYLNIPTTNLVSGIYILQISNESGSSIQKIRL